MENKTIGRWLLSFKRELYLGESGGWKSPNVFEADIMEWTESEEYLRIHIAQTFGSEWYNIERILFIEKLSEKKKK